MSTAENASPEEPAELRYDVDEKPSHVLSAVLGFQIVILILAGIVLVPVIVLKAGGQSAELTTWAVFAALFVSGLTTAIQARPIGPIGAGYVLFMGTSGAFIAVSTMAVTQGGLPLLGTLVVISSLAQFLFSARLSLLRRIITPTVGGTVVMLIAVAVFPICFDMLNRPPANPNASSLAGPATAGVTFLVILVASLLGKGAMRLWAPLGGVVAGCAVAGAFGIIDLTQIRESAWVGLPAASWPGLDLSFGSAFFALLPGFLLVTLVGAIETFGDGIAIQRVSQRKRRPVDFKVVQGAVNADGVGNLLSGLLGTLPNTTYSTSISVVDLTGVAARRVGVYGGLIMMALAFLPKVSAVIQAVPDAVAGSYILILIVLLFAHGLRLVFEDGFSYENGLIVCLAFWLGMAFQGKLVFPEQMPEWMHTILDNGMTSGGLVALALTALVSLKSRARKKLRLDPEMKSVTQLKAFLDELVGGAGWERAARERLQLAAEEAFIYLVEKERESERETPLPIHLVAQELKGNVELEFATGPGAENVEQRLSELPGLSEASPEEDVGLRILRQLVKRLRHEQFHDRCYLSLVLDNRPAA